jgi:glycosyltransferase involved in cell wall biosynthesis
MLAVLLKKKIIIQPLGFYEPWSLQQKKIKKSLAWFIYQKKILQLCDLIHCASYQEKKNLLILDNNFKTKILPYGIPSIFIKNKANKKKINKRAIFFSRIDKKKGIENLISCWNILKNTDWKLDIVGPQNDLSYFLKIKSLAKNNQNIKFLRPIYTSEEKKKLFNYYDFLILPTFNENFGMVVLEALSRGLPVLTTKNTPWVEIKKTNSGWYIKNDHNHLLRQLKKIFKLNLYSFKKKSFNAINLSKKYNWNCLAKQYLCVYKKLLNH